MSLSAQELATAVVLLGGAIGALTYIAKWVRNLVHVADRIEALVAPTARVVNKELTKNSGSSMYDRVEELGKSTEATRGLVQLVGEELVAHGRQSRAAMAIYRKALADQGIHLPIAPGEDGFGDLKEFDS